MKMTGLNADAHGAIVRTHTNNNMIGFASGKKIVVFLLRGNN